MELYEWVIYSLNLIVILLAFASTFAFFTKIKEYDSSVKSIIKLIIGANLIFFVLQIPILLADYFFHHDYFV